LFYLVSVLVAVERFIYSSKLTDGLIAYVRSVGKPRRCVSGMNCDRAVQFISLSLGIWGISSCVTPIRSSTLHFVHVVSRWREQK
jgi:hypothetical protein